jgi:iron complex outermembrane receptor protein
MQKKLPTKRRHTLPKFLLVAGACLWLPTLLWAQNATLTGVVTSSTGEALVGVSVVVKGTTLGVSTGLSGEYSIIADPATATLVFSFMGMATKEEIVNGRSRIDVTLMEDSQSLNEVVVTALGIKRDARALGYAISSIKGDQLVKSGVTANPLSSLYGKAAGVGIQATAAGPTGGVQIRIRGASALDDNSSLRPLFVVDGVPIYDQESAMTQRNYDPLRSFDYGSGVNDINPEDIESMEILKGAKASVLYGSAGANGVVLITTKDGSKAKGLGVTLSYGHEWEQPYSLIEFQNEFGSGRNEYAFATVRKIQTEQYSFGPKFDGQPIMGFDGQMHPYSAYEDNYMAMFQMGHSDNMTVAVSGGNEKANARFSYTNFGYEGTMANQTQTKNTLSFNGAMYASEFVNVNFTQNLYITKTQNRRQNMNVLIANGTFNRDYDLELAMDSYTDPDGYMYDDGYLKGMGWPDAFTVQNGFFDLLWNQSKNKNTDAKMHSITAIKVNLQFLPYLSLRLQGGLDYTVTDFIRQDKVVRPNTETGGWQGGAFSNAVEKNNIQQYEAYFTFDKKFMDERLDVGAFFGPSYKNVAYDRTGVGTLGNFLYPDFWAIENGSEWPTSYANKGAQIASYNNQGEALYSVLGQATFAWQRKYYLELQARNDWSSTLPKQNRSYFYPGASFTWNFTEDFKIPYVNYGKLRLSWADVGRPATRYYALRTYSMGLIGSEAYKDVNDITGPSDLFSGDLKPERKREVEAGFDLRFFERDRLGVDISYYNNNFYDQIMAVPLSSLTGAKNIRINAGRVNNQGFEALLKGVPVMTNSLTWDVSLTLTRQWNKIIELYEGITQVNRTVQGVVNRAEVGRQMGELWTQDYKHDDNGNKIVGDNGLYSLSNDPNDQICVGNVNPNLFGGFSSNVTLHGDWGAVNFSIGIDYKVGGKILSFSNIYLKGNGLSQSSLPGRPGYGGLTYTDGLGRVRHDGVMLEGVKADGTQNDITISAFDYYDSFRRDANASRWRPDEIRDNSYAKFREAALSYTLPQQWTQMVKIQRLTMAITARNLFYIYKNIENIDHESLLGTNSWVENSNYPTSRTFGFNVSIGF